MSGSCFERYERLRPPRPKVSLDEVVALDPALQAPQPPPLVPTSSEGGAGAGTAEKQAEEMQGASRTGEEGRTSKDQHFSSPAFASPNAPSKAGAVAGNTARLQRKRRAKRGKKGERICVAVPSPSTTESTYAQPIRPSCGDLCKNERRFESAPARAFQPRVLNAKKGVDGVRIRRNGV